MGLTSQLNRKYRSLIARGIYPVCYLCGKKITKQNEVSQDNLIPKALGGETPLKRLQPHPRFVQDDLPYFQQQDDKEAFERHKQAMANRAFAWYRLSKKKDKSRLVDIYNKIATMKQRD